jgi:2-dehydropantoate 2-reductase
MSEKFRIAILGIGGVGGYFGGKLAEYFADSNEVEIIFIARGESAKAIAQNGLKIITPENETIVRPHAISENPSEIGKIDLFILCTKAYDLAESIEKYRDCITEKMAILPLLNGVNHSETVQQILPNAEVWKGCCFIVARLVEKGIVKVDSEIRLLQFGSKSAEKSKLEKVENILKFAGIQTEFSDEIEKTIWEKFIFISSLATLTSALDKTKGEILSSNENRQTLIDLIAEVSNLARAKKVNVAENIEELTLEKIQKAPQNATSSMHADFAKKGRTELETLTGYVVNESKLSGSLTPTYQRLYAELLNRNG